MKKNKKICIFNLIKYKYKIKTIFFSLIVVFMPMTIISQKSSSKIKSVISTDKLVTKSFEVSNEITSDIIDEHLVGYIKVKKDIKLPKEVKITYAKTKTSSDYKQELENHEPLKNGDKIFIKFSIDAKYTQTHQFPTSFKNKIIEFEVKNIKTQISIFEILFEQIEKDGKKTIRILNPNYFKDRLKLFYAKKTDMSKEPLENDFKEIMPLDLSTNDVLYIKFVIKNMYKKKYTLYPSDDKGNYIKRLIIKSTITKKEIKSLIDKMQKTWLFYIDKSSGHLKLKMKNGEKIKLPKELEILYAKKTNNQEPQEKDYKKKQPIGLKKGDKLYIKLVIKDQYKSALKSISSLKKPITFTIQSYKKKVDIKLLNSDSFEVIGINNQGKMQLKNNVILPKQIKVFFVKNPKENDLGKMSFKNNYPTNLKNNDIVYIKFAIKDQYTNQYEFPLSFSKTSIKFNVNNLSQKKLLKSKSKKRISKSTIAGIVIGAIAIVSCICFLIIKIFKIKIFKKYK